MSPVAIAAAQVVHGFGAGLDSLVAGLRAGRSAARPLDEPWARAVGVHAAVRCPVPTSGERIEALLGRVLAGLATPGEPERRAVFAGVGLSSVTPEELEEDLYPFVRDGVLDRTAALSRLEAGRAPARHRPERLAARAAVSLGARGPVATSFSACAAGAEAFVAAARTLQRGEADYAWVVASDSMVHPLGALSFEALGALGSGRPFDRDRDGFLLGEAAVVLRLDRVPTGRPLGFFLGAGSSVDAWRVTAPHPDGVGAEQAMRRALADAGVDGVAWVKAHATGTPVGDAAEARAVARVLPGVPVLSLKGALGHTLSASGLVEVAALCGCWARGFTPGTIGSTDVGGLPVEVFTEPTPVPAAPVLANSFGFGGQNTALVLAPAEGPWTSASSA